ncbi:hypothetical protein OOT46_21845 [Aquabacterium sp. A7-Y]|uniref:hypothetical protein n=1 Tax=Aquabacterium sp. A7-Y TaxID=1349605 RepID=UPI00223DD811|nr:hypothetical protein [Aquabacterium sp. A7-Y]MCW7540471.1 hypothetical protein [Aquabacterium sp. A7-Y]
MKRLLYTVAGGALFAVLSYFLVELFAQWYGPRYIKSDSDIGNIYMISLGFMLVCLIIGAVFGFKLAGKRPSTTNS